VVLVFVQFVEHALTQVKSHQATDIAGTEPWLVFKEEGVEWEVMAVEDCRTEKVGHFRSV
jgi:hypothetical protein